MNVLEVTDQSFDAQVLASPIPVLVDFTATWCTPCRALAPILEKVAGEGHVKVVAVDGDEAPQLAVRFGVKGFPTVIGFVNGRETGRHVGLTTRERLLRLVATPASDGAPAQPSSSAIAPR